MAGDSSKLCHRHNFMNETSNNGVRSDFLNITLQVAIEILLHVANKMIFTWMVMMWPK